jgi:N-acylglucosamine-6-phosphate 2-epimerase
MAHAHEFTGGLIVSCQAPVGSPMRDPHAMTLMALAAQKAGAVGIRAEGAADIAAIRLATWLPIIGIRKHRYANSDVYITATQHDIDIVADAGAEIVAVDATFRLRPRGETLAAVIGQAKARGLAVMADLSTVDEASSALEAGADYLGTTLIPPSTEDAHPGGPNISAVQRLHTAHPTATLIAEGRYSTQDDVRRAFDAGATAVVVGTAITDTYALALSLVEATPRSLHACIRH